MKRLFPTSSTIAGALILAAASPTTPGDGAEEPAIAPAPVRELWVPADRLDAVLKKFPRAVMLTPEQYRALLRDAGNPARPDDPDTKPPLAAAIREAAYEGELGVEVATFTARFTVECFDDRWTEIPLALPRDGLAGVSVDESSAIRVLPGENGKNPQPLLVVRGKGSHTVTASFRLPVTRSPSGNSIRLPSPGVAAASLALRLPGETKLDSALPFVLDAEDPALARFVLPAEPGAEFEIRWTARNIAAIPGAAIFQTCRYLYSIDATRVQADLGLVLDSSLTDLPGRFEISLPDGARVLSIEGSELLRWTRLPAGKFEAVLVPGKRQAADLRLLVEADVSAPAAGEGAEIEVALPVAEIDGVHRASGTFAVLGSEDVRVQNIATGPLTVAAPEAVDPELRESPDFVAGYRFPVTVEPPRVTLSPVRERHKVQLDTRVELRRESVNLTRNLTFIPLEGRLFAAEVVLPDGEEFLSLAPAGDFADGFSWSRSGPNRVRCQWQQGSVAGSAPTTLAIETRRDPEGWFDLDTAPLTLSLAPPGLPGAESVTGYVAVAFDDSFRVETVNATGLEARDGRTTPVTGTLAWFRLGDYALDLDVSRRAAEIEAAVTAHALPLQSSLEIEGQLDLDIRHTPVAEVVVKIADPAAAALARWDSPLLAEKRLDRDTGAWTLVFHDEQIGARRLRFRLSLPLGSDTPAAGPAGEGAAATSGEKRFAASLPVFSVPAAKRLRGDWTIEANTDTELSFDARGLDAVDSLRAPAVEGYQPRHRVIAAYRFRGDAWSLVVSGVRHAPESLVTAVIDSLRLDTVVSTDGPARHQVVLSLRATGEQFLEAALPEGAVLWSLIVDGRAVKPVVAEYRPGTLRVQLPAREEAGQTPIAVKIVYQTPGRVWAGSGAETLAPVRFAERIPVMRSEWFLHLPEGYDYLRFRSNLREDFQIVDRTLLGQTWGNLPPFGSTEITASASSDRSPISLDSGLPTTEAARGYRSNDEYRVTRNPSRLEFLIKSDEESEIPEDHSTSLIELREAKLSTIVLPSVEFVETPLRDALDFLRQRSVELDTDTDPAQKGVNIVPLLDEGGPVGDTPITLKLTNVPLGEALRYTLSLASLKYKVESHAVVVVPLSAPDKDLVTNVYRVPPDFFSAEFRASAAAPADPFAAPAAPPSAGGQPAARLTAKEILESYGVVFGPGASAAYNAETGQLIVRNSEEEQELAEAVTESIRSSGDSRDLVDSESGEAVTMETDAEDKVPYFGYSPMNGRMFENGGPLGRNPITAGIRSGSQSVSADEIDALNAATSSGDVRRSPFADLRLPDLDFENTPLPDAIAQLEAKAREAAGAAQPMGQGQNQPNAGGGATDGFSADRNLSLRVEGEGEADKRVTLSLKNTNLLDALDRLTRSSGTEYRVTASGIVIAAPGTIPPEQLRMLVLELPNSAFETSDGNGDVRRQSARAVLTAAGIDFPPGTSTAYNFDTGRLAVRNTPENLEAVYAHFIDYLPASTETAGATNFAARGGNPDLDGAATAAAATAQGLKGFSAGNTGLIPLDFELPRSGRSYAFSGLYAPEAIRFRYVNWERQIRVAWLWMLAGGAAFWFLAVRRWRRPVAVGLTGVVALTFFPLIVSESLLAFCNSLLLGWLAGFGLWIAWRLACAKMWRRHPAGESRDNPLAKASPVLPILTLGVFLLTDGPATAGEKPAPAAEPAFPAAHTVVVPFAHDPDHPAAPDPGDARRYYLDSETFDRLWKLAKASRLRENATDDSADAGFDGRDAILTEALHRAAVGEERLDIEARFTLLTRGKPWQSVPLPFSGVNLASLELDGAAASYREGAVLVENPGRHQLVARFEVPLAADAATWKIPSATAASLAIVMDSELAEPVVNGGLPLVKSAGETPERPVFTVALGQTGEIAFRRRLKTSGRGMTQPNVATIDAHLFVTPALERLEASYRLEFAGQEENSFAIAFDPSVTPVRFDIPNLATWRLVDRGEAEARTLEFELTRPVRDGLTVKMIGERLAAESGERRVFPVLEANATRLVRNRSLLHSPDLDLRTEPGPAHRRIEFRAEGVDIAGFQAAGSWALAGNDEPLTYALSPRPPSRHVRAEYVFQTGAGKLETLAQFRIESPDPALHDLAVELPAGATVQAVGGNRVKDWWRAGDELFVRFFGDTPEVTALVVHLAAETDTAVPIAIAPLTLPGYDADDIDGTGLVVSHVTEDTRLRFDQDRRVVREVDPAAVSADTEVLPPLERKRAFRFDRGGFSGEISLSPLAARHDVSWVMLAQAHESWLRLSVRADVAVSRSAVDRVSFSTEADAPEFRVLSPEVREVRTAIENGRRLYTVIFQRFVSDAIAFTLESEIAHAGAVSPPDIEFDGATRRERFLIVENRGADRLSLAREGLDPTVRELFPYMPATLRSAELFRARPGWKLQLSVEKLETSAGNDAVILYAELSTAFRANGEEWMKASYRVQNRSLQFLPVALPEKAELVSVTVAGREIRADRGEKDGREVVLVPLIQTKPGQLAYDVGLVLRSRERVRRGDADRLDSFERTLDDPELVGLGVERTLWSVWLPEGHRLADSGGNMRAVAASSNLFEKIQAGLGEVEQLNKLGSSNSVDFETLQLTCANGDLLLSRLENGLGQIDAARAQAVRRQIAAQRAQVDENRKKLTQTSPPPIVLNVGGGFQGRDAQTIDEVTWDANNSALVTRDQVIQKKNEAQVRRVQSQIRWNDNLSIGNDFINAKNLARQDAEPSEPSGKDIRVTSKFVEDSRQTGAVDEKLAALRFSQIGHGGREFSEGGAGAAAGAAAAPAADASADMDRSKREPKKAKESDVYIQLDKSSAMKGVAGKKAETTAAPAEGNARQQLGRVGIAPAAPATVSAGYANEFVFSRHPATESPVSATVGEALRAEGARSVAVDFPTEGAAYHFQKLKDHAELRIESARPGDFTRLIRFAGFLICCAAIWLGDRLFRRLRRRRAHA